MFLPENHHERCSTPSFLNRGEQQGYDRVSGFCFGCSPDKPKRVHNLLAIDGRPLAHARRLAGTNAGIGQRKSQHRSI